MIQLEALRLINWYHFADETFPMSGSTLLLGDNGSGKSTVLDAIQLALVADLTQIRFNKAANEQSQRNLQGYVRYKLGTEDESRAGALRYGRGACTAYVLLQFSSGPKGAPPFVAGVVLEALEHDSQVARNHFLVPGLSVADIPALAGGETIRPLREFRAELRGLPNVRWFQESSEYRAELRQRLGTLPEDFHRLIARALAFRPLGDIRNFVFAYLLDARPVDTAALQANLENYKRLEAQAKDAEARIAELDRICALGDRIASEQRTAESHRYVHLRADVDLAQEAETRARLAIDDAYARQEQLAADIVRIDEQKQILVQERDHFRDLLNKVPDFRLREHLRLGLETTRREIADAHRAGDEARKILAAQTAALATLLSQEARDVRHRRGAWIDQRALLGSPEEPAVVERLRAVLQAQGPLGTRDLGLWNRRLDETLGALLSLEARLKDAVAAVRAEGESLHAEHAALDQGRQMYPKAVDALLHLLKSKLKGRREPQPFCELVEVPNDRWRDAVEGYLNTRRFDVLVAPEDFPRALGLYERHKRDYHLPGTGAVFIAGVGLVDIEKLRTAVRPRDPRSLAEQVTTEDALARAYADYVLGDVIRCETEQELRQHRTGITATVMVYRNHVARQTPAEVFRRHYLGRAAQVRRRAEVTERLTVLAEELVALDADLGWVGKTITQCRQATQGLTTLPDRLEQAGTLPTLQLRERAAERDLGSLDLREADRLEGELRKVQIVLEDLDGRRDRNLKDQGECSTQIDQLKEKADELKVARQTAVTALAVATGSMSAERERALGDHYGEVTRGRRLREVRETYEEQHRNILTRIENYVKELIRLKTAYASTRQFGGDHTGDGYAEFQRELELWRGSRLPEYAERIAKAKQQALEQLAEDIIFKLRENLLDVRRQINGLNQALREVAFGNDRYEFVLEVNPEHKNFHDLIMDAGHFQQDSLFGDAARRNPATRQTLEDLLNQLIHAEATRVKTELEAKADYREYFDYDLQIRDTAGNVSRYSRVAGDKSGGETQNPYYVAIFASMYRLYRRLSPDGRPTCGLVLLDEAFSKMDEYRIEATLQFARALQLQLILATPKERSELVIPRVETSLYIYRDPETGVPTVLPWDREFSDNGRPASDPSQDPAATA